MSFDAILRLQQGILHVQPKVGFHPAKGGISDIWRSSWVNKGPRWLYGGLLQITVGPTSKRKPTTIEWLAPISKWSC